MRNWFLTLPRPKSVAMNIEPTGVGRFLGVFCLALLLEALILPLQAGASASHLVKKDIVLSGGVPRGVPQAGPGVLVPGQAGDAGGADDQAVPLGVESAPDIEGLDRAGLVAAVALGIDAPVAFGRGLGGGDGLERGQQGRLVGLDLGEHRVAGVAGDLKGFFDSAARRR